MESITVSAGVPDEVFSPGQIIKSIDNKFYGLYLTAPKKCSYIKCLRRLFSADSSKVSLFFDKTVDNDFLNKYFIKIAKIKKIAKCSLKV